MVSQMVGRQTFPMQNKAIPTALGGFGAINAGTDDRSSVSSLQQGFTNGTNSWRPSNNIWGNGTLSTGFASAQRESARGAENGTYRKPATEVIEGKTGSGSLVASSETDTWSNQRSPWNNPDSSSQPAQQRRASSVSPVSQIPSSQPYVEAAQPTAQRFAPSRSVMMGQGFASKSSSRPVLDPTSGHFVARRPADHPYNDYGRIVELDTATQRPDSMRPWTDGPNLQSPTDDRRSIGNSEYFSSSSTAQSRSGSLPPSRQGSDPVQFQPSTDFPPYTKMQAPAASRGHTTSLSTHANARHAERNDSVASDMIPAFSRMSVDNGVSDQAMLISKSYLSNANGHNGFPAASGQSSVTRQALVDISNNISTPEDIHLNGHGSFTPDGYPGQYADPLAHIRGLQSGNRGAMTPNGEFRPGQYYSTGGTPPMFDSLYPSRNDQNIRPHSNGHSTLLDRKLRNVQQEQIYLHAQYQHMIAQAQQLRPSFDPYHFGMAPSMSMNGIAPALAMAPMPGMMPALEPPRAPKEQEFGTGFRSALLDEFKHNGRSKRYELKDIYDHICEFSGDQHGSRFIQQKLETANSDEKERVFKEIHPNAMQLMTDVFGNYVIQKFFEHGDQNQKKILANRMKGSVLSLSIQMYGCRVVQKALEHVLVDQQAAMVKELERSVLTCVKDQNGNHVIQKALERVPAQHVRFICDAFEGHVASLSMHGYGCRVIQRLLEFGEPSCQRSVTSEVHTAALTLIPDPFGNYVTQHIIVHGQPEDRDKMIDLVTSHVIAFTKHKYASNVVEKCLIYGDDKQRRNIMLKMIEKTERGESSLVSLIKDEFGNYVIQKTLDTLNAPDYFTFLEHVRSEVPKAKRTGGGKQITSIEDKLNKLDRAETAHETLQHNSTSSTPAKATQNAMANTQTNNALMRPEATTQYVAVGAATPRTNTY